MEEHQFSDLPSGFWEWNGRSFFMTAGGWREYVTYERLMRALQIVL